MIRLPKLKNEGETPKNNEDLKAEAKAKKIRLERNRLKKVFTSLDKNKLIIVQALINNAAFMIVELEELQNEISRDGVSEKYKNGANQWGVKQSTATEVHISMTRNLSTIIKQLLDLVPKEERKDGKFAEMRKFI